jgi:hypothetical protein
MPEQITNDDNARADAILAELDRLKLENSALQGERDTLRRQIDSSDVKAQADQAAQRSDAQLQEHLDLCTTARRHLGDRWNHRRDDGRTKSPSEIRRELMAKLDPGWKLDSADDVYLKAACDSAVRNEEKRQLQITQHATHPGIDFGGQFGRRSDARGSRMHSEPDGDEGEDDGETKKAYDSMVQRMKDAWKLPPRKDRKSWGIPGRSAFNGGNDGRQLAGGFSGGMGS